MVCDLNSVCSYIVQVVWIYILFIKFNRFLTEFSPRGFYSLQGLLQKRLDDVYVAAWNQSRIFLIDNDYSDS